MAPRSRFEWLTWSSVLTFAAYAVVWLLLAAPLSVFLFLHTSTSLVVASHDAVIRPTMDGRVTLHTGPFLPDIRSTSGYRVGVDVTLGKTQASSTEELVQRYAFIASQPEGQIARIEETVRGLAFAAALRGGAISLLPVLAWAGLGRRRRAYLLKRLRSWRGAAVVTTVVLLGVAVWQPWPPYPDMGRNPGWQPLPALVPGVTLPAEVARLQVSSDGTTGDTARLVQSAISTYEKSKTFYAEAEEAATHLVLRQPSDGETVALLVTDRHDNIGMDPVARAIGDAGGATVVLDAGDDTSSGEPWEAFSLDSLNAAFEGYAAYAVSGNHDNGDFVSRYLEDLGWTSLRGEVGHGPGGSRILGDDDPRSSGLGDWRDETGLSFAQHADRLADAACSEPSAVGVLLVHDSDSGTPALQRGCVDLVLAGHVHVQVGPTKVRGSNGHLGWTYTNGTTGGAAYAIAVGSKLKREAEVTLVTFRDGRPVGLQPVTLQTNGVFHVSPFLPLS